MAERTIYLDNNATTPVAPEVVEAMLPFLKDQYFNPSSGYDQARGPRDAVERARELVARTLGASSKSEVVFTGSASEGNNAAIWGVLRANPDRRHVVVTAVEHPAVIEVAKEVQRYGFRATILPVDSAGRLDPKDLIRAIEPDTAIVSIMHANNETGVIFPVGDLARVVKEVDPAVVFHTDATQTVGKVHIDLANKLKHVDLLTMSGHKVHAPKGVGAMFIRRGTRWRPYVIGGHQERGRRAGTENVPYIVGLGRACELASQHLLQMPRLRKVQQRLEAAMAQGIPCVRVNGAGADRLPNTSNFSFEYVEGEAILFALGEHGICASSGSACTSGSLDPSHVLKAMGVPFTAAHGSLRISTCPYTPDSDIDALLGVLPGIIASLRRLSPYWDVEKDAPKEGTEVFVAGKYSEGKGVDG
jgi:cysteine desulfurase